MRSRLIGGVVPLVSVAMAAGQACNPSWSASFPAGDTDGPVHASLLFDDGTGSAVYIGGGFTRVAGVPARGVARWNGTAWSAVGPGFDGPVHALTIHNDGTGSALYAGGLFGAAGATPANCIAKWSGGQWTAVGPISGNGALVGAPVRALISFVESGAPRLFVGGEFLRLVGGSPTSTGVFRWVNNAWQQAGSGTLGLRVAAFAVHNEGNGLKLYAAGRSSFAGTSPVVRWEGNGWISLSGSLSPQAAVNALAVYDAGTGPALYAAGETSLLNGPVASRVARWQNSSWTPVTGGPDQGVRALAITDLDGLGGQPPAMIVGGPFSTVGGSPAAGVALYNGSVWTVPSQGVNDAPGVLLPFSQGGVNKVLVGGAFSTAGGQPASRLATFSAAGWAAVGGTAQGMGLGATPRAFAWFDDDGPGPNAAKLYVGGEFRAAGGGVVNSIATWDGTAWSAVGGGADGPIHALNVHTDIGGTFLYAAGEFLNIGGAPALRIARWNGSAWQGVAAGLGGPGSIERVLALETYTPAGQPARLVAAGFFTPPGSTVPQGFASWDGAAWTTLGPTTSVNGATSIAAFDDGSGPALFAAGGTYFLGGVYYVAKWNGAAWLPVSTGLSASAYLSALAVHDNGSGPALYGAGSNVVQTGPTTHEHVGRWNGAAWAAAGPGGPGLDFTNSVQCLVSHDDGSGSALYAGGSFQVSTTGAPMRHLARLKGGAWAEVPVSMDLPRGAIIAAMASAPDGSLYLGGSFAGAGGVSSGNIARLSCGCYANCDGSTTSPVLNVQDFGCFLNAFAGGDPYANCDGSTAPPVLNVQDFGCFLNAFAAGCP